MAAKKDDLGQAEVQSARDDARAKGYEGASPTEGKNDQFSLKSGPKSPSAAEQLKWAADQRAADLGASVNG